MIVFSEDRTSFFNFDAAQCVYLSQNGGVRICFSGASYKAGNYETEILGRRAIEILGERMKVNQSGAVYMPTKEEAETRLKNAPDVKQRASNGKKTVRRGGS